MSNTDAKYHFYEFGRNMQFVGIFTILTLIPYFSFLTGILALIFIFIALGNIKTANYNLNSPLLEEYRSKFIGAFIIRLVGLFILTGGVTAIIVIVSSFYSGIFNLLPAIIPSVIGFILLIVGASMEMGAWDKLKEFFEENRKIFPNYVVNDVIEGCEKLRTGALMFALAFLGITILIGFILQVIGYFKLATLNKMDLNYSHPIEITSSQNANHEITKESGEVNFCPSCGSEVIGEGRYCSYCGAPLN